MRGTGWGRAEWYGLSPGLKVRKTPGRKWKFRENPGNGVFSNVSYTNYCSSVNLSFSISIHLYVKFHRGI